MPSVIFIEPEYTDGPHGVLNDDHPPTGVTQGNASAAAFQRAVTKIVAEHPGIATGWPLLAAGGKLTIGL